MTTVDALALALGWLMALFFTIELVLRWTGLRQRVRPPTEFVAFLAVLMWVLVIIAEIRT